MKNARFILWATSFIWLLPNLARADAVGIGPIMCAYPDGYRPCSAGPSAYNPPPPPYNPLPEMNQRYLIVLAQLKARMNGLQSLLDGAPPATMDELSRRLDIAFVAGAYRLDSLNATRGRLAGDVTVSQARLQAMREEANRMERYIASASERKNEFQQRRDAAVGRTREAQAGMAAIQVRRDALDKRADILTKNIVQWLAVGSPPRPRLAPAEAAQARGRLDRENLLADLTPAGAGPAVLRPTRPPLPTGPKQPVSFRTPPVGGVTEKLAAIATLPSLIDVAAQAVDQLNPRLAIIQAGVDDVVMRSNALRQTHNMLEDEVEGMRWSADNAEMQAITVTQNERAAARNMLRSATETYILQTLRDSVAIPAVKTLLKSNQAGAVVASLTNQKVAALYATGKSVITTPAGGTWTNLKAFLETEQVILDGLKDPMNYIAAAAQELGSSGRSRANELGLAICAGQTRHVMNLTEKAAGSLPGPLGEISRGMVDGACH